MRNDKLKKLDRLLMTEAAFAEGLKKTTAAKRLEGARADLLEYIREVDRSGDLSLLIATERAIVEGDLARYANSLPMTGSLTAALNEIAAIERHIGIVDDPVRYRVVDQAHSLSKNRKGGLPFDEAQQALASHHARLNNMDKSRLGDDEKKIIEARKSAVSTAGKLYAARQSKSLGVEPAQGRKGRKRGRAAG